MAIWRSKRRRYRAKPKNGGKSLVWWITWPIHTPIRYLVWWPKEFIVGLSIGFIQGVMIGWYEVRAETTLRKWKVNGVSIYDTNIWSLLRDLTFAPYRDNLGWVQCQDCRQHVPDPHCHHIKPISAKPRLAFTPGNLTPLCPACHDAAHPEIRISRNDQFTSRRPPARVLRVGSNLSPRFGGFRA